eukprot:scaffold2142_cov165-Amphora_coffeaeformis.AAC.8
MPTNLDFSVIALLTITCRALTGWRRCKLYKSMSAIKSYPQTYMIRCAADATEIARRLLFGAGTNEIMIKPLPKEFIPNLVRRLRTDANEQAVTRHSEPGES